MKRLPKWAWAVIGLLVLLLVVALVLPYFLDVDRYRTAIAAAIEEGTGRPVELGKIRARLLPTVGFVVEDIRIGNPPEFAPGHLFTAESIRGNLAWGPLFRREFQLSSMVVVRPRLVLLEDARGATNYELPKRPPKPPGESAEGGSSFRLADLDSIRLEDVELVLGDLVTVRGQPVEAPLLRATGISAQVREVAFEAARLAEWQADADLGGVKLEVAGLPGAITFRSGQLTLREAAIKSEFEADVAGASRIRGRLEVPDVRRVRATFELSSPLLDLAPLLADSGPRDTPSSQGARRAPTSRDLVAEGRATFSRVRKSPYEATDAEARVRVFGDRIEISPAKAKLYGGALEATARLNRGGDPQRFTSSLRVTGVDVAQLLAADPATRDKMTGTGELKLDIAGDTGPNALDRVSGAGEFAVREGSFPGLDLGKTMQAVGQLQRALHLGQPASDVAGRTTFTLLNGDLNIRGGRISSQQIRLDSSSGLVEMRGSVGFDGSLNYDGRATLSASTGEQAGKSPADILTGVLGGVLGRDVQRLTVPFALRGTLSDPKVQPGRGLPSVESPQPQPPPQEQQRRSLRDLLRRPG